MDDLLTKGPEKFRRTDSMDFPYLDANYRCIPHPALCEIPIDKVEINAGMFNSGR